MSDLLWFKGITWNTPIGDIGWTWVFLFGLIIALAINVYKIYEAITTRSKGGGDES